MLKTTPEGVYRAFLDGEAMGSWLPPQGFTVRVEHIDSKVGDFDFDPITEILFVLEILGFE